MVELTRTIRFCLNCNAASAGPTTNSFSAWPAMSGLGCYYELQVTCTGDVDPVTGYFVNIKHIDTAVRHVIVPWLDSLVADHTDRATIPLGATMQQISTRLQDEMEQTVSAVRLNLTPFLSLTLESQNMGQVLIRQQFEFAAAHRLHVDELSDDENQRVFGKCNNPSGHGHNYRVEVAFLSPIDDEGNACSAAVIDELVDRVVIEKLDHKHLNVDVPEFKTLNPSVENIAKVIHGMLAAESGSIGLTLDEISVWETGKTKCTYRGVPSASKV